MSQTARVWQVTDVKSPALGRCGLRDTWPEFLAMEVLGQDRDARLQRAWSVCSGIDPRARHHDTLTAAVAEHPLTDQRSGSFSGVWAIRCNSP